jgi:hypothetical protein
MNEQIDIGWIDPEQVSGHFAHSIAEAARDMQYFECLGQVHRYSASQPIVARNTIVQQFLDGNSEWLWMVDADMVFDKGHPMKLWSAASECGVRMVSGLAMIWKDQKFPVPSIFYEDETGGLMNVYNQLMDEPHEVAATGLASSLVHREVFEAIEAPRHPDYRWFDFLPNEDIGIVGSEMTGIDVQFFVRARQLGYKLIVEPAARTWHIENMMLGYDEWNKAWHQSSSLEAKASSENMSKTI